MKTKVVPWEYECPYCDTANALPNPPPATHMCRECGRHWDVQKLHAAGYVVVKERVPK
jgi:DNA primase large subunit